MEQKIKKMTGFVRDLELEEFEGWEQETLDMIEEVMNKGSKRG